MRACWVILVIAYVAVPAASTHAIMSLRLASIQRTKHELRPMEATAVRVARDASAPMMLRYGFAHDLLRVYHDLAGREQDHTWHRTVSNRYCEVVMHHAPDLVAWCASSTQYCMCQGLTETLRACHNRVSPWGHDTGVCESTCTDHPLRNLCIERPRRASHPTAELAADLHGVGTSYRSWRHREHDTRHEQWYADVKHRLHLARKAPIAHTLIPTEREQPRRNTTSGNGTNASNGTNATAGVTDVTGMTVAALIRYDRHTTLAMLGKNRGNGTTLCTAHTAIARTSASMWPAAIVTMTQNDRETLRKVLDADGCDVGVTWRGVAEILYLHPCAQELQDSSHARIPAACAQHDDTVHHGLAQRRLLHNPTNSMFVVVPPDPDHHAEARAQHTASHAEHCDRLHRHSRVGRSPGAHSEFLTEHCAHAKKATIN